MNVEKWFKDGTSFDIKELRYLKPPTPTKRNIEGQTY